MMALSGPGRHVLPICVEPAPVDGFLVQRTDEFPVKQAVAHVAIEFALALRDLPLLFAKRATATVSTIRRQVERNTRIASPCRPPSLHAAAQNVFFVRGRVECLSTKNKA